MPEPTAEAEEAAKAFLRAQEERRKQVEAMLKETEKKPTGMAGRIAQQQLKEKVKQEIEQEAEDTRKS